MARPVLDGAFRHNSPADCHALTSTRSRALPVCAVRHSDVPVHRSAEHLKPGAGGRRFIAIGRGHARGKERALFGIPAPAALEHGKGR